MTTADAADAADAHRLATQLRNSPHLMLRDDLDRAAELLDLLADAAEEAATH